MKIANSSKDLHSTLSEPCTTAVPLAPGTLYDYTYPIALYRYGTKIFQLAIKPKKSLIWKNNTRTSVVRGVSFCWCVDVSMCLVFWWGGVDDVLIITSPTVYVCCMLYAVFCMLCMLRCLEGWCLGSRWRGHPWSASAPPLRGESSTSTGTESPKSKQAASWRPSSPASAVAFLVRQPLWYYI